MKKLFVVGILATFLAGCNFVTFSNNLDSFAASVQKYAPLVGKSLLNIGGILVTAECSPALTPVSQTATNILQIVAPNTSAANSVETFLARNQAVAAQLCPLIAAIKADVGAIPKGTPVQVIDVPATTKTAL